MDETVIVLMLKDSSTGFLEKEIGFLKILENENLITNTFVEEENGELFIHLKITTDRDVEDWEYSAIYDYYDMCTLENYVVKMNEDENCFNPTWEIIVRFEENMDSLAESVTKILEYHKNELLEVYKIVQENKNEYI